MRILSLLLLFFGAVSSSFAEDSAPPTASQEAAKPQDVPTQCRAQVSYTVKRGDSEEAVLFAGEHAEGPSEARAKEALSARLFTAKRAAQEECRSRHENLSGCVAGKFAANATLLDRLEFGARKSLQDAIKADCEKSQGVCLGGKEGAIECQPLPAPASTEAAPAGGEKGDKKEASDTKKGGAKKK